MVIGEYEQVEFNLSFLVNVYVLPEFDTVQPVPEALWTVNPAGMTSVTVTVLLLTEADAHIFETTMLQVFPFVASAHGLFTVLLTVKSILGFNTVVITLAQLLVRS